MARLLRKTLTASAKVALIAAGAGFGLVRGLRLRAGIADRSAAIQVLEERIDDLQLQIRGLRARDEQLQTGLERAIRPEDLSAALDKALGRVQRGIDVRFEDQVRSVEALRAMVGHTDELLERLLDRLESMRSDAELQHAGR